MKLEDTIKGLSLSLSLSSLSLLSFSLSHLSISHSFYNLIIGFQEILAGKLDSCPEAAFFMAGNIEEVKENAVKLQASN